MDIYLKEKEIYENTGTVMFSAEKSIFSIHEMNELEKLSNSLPLEHVEVGDANEPNYLEVGRMMTDIKIPEVVNKPESEKAIDILLSSKARNFFKFILSENKLCLRRLQYNILKKNCFVGLHLDTDSNPDYIVAVVLQFGGNFVGGDYVVYGGNMPPRSYHPARHSMIISNCNYKHEVTKIVSGVRKSLVFFLSKSDSFNKREN